MTTSSDATARLARSSSRRSSPYTRSTSARAVCAFSSFRAYACFRSGTPEHAARASERMADTSAGVYSEHTFSRTRCVPPRSSIIASRCSITRPHSWKYSSGMTYPFGRTIELVFSSSPTATGVPSSRRRSTRTTFPLPREDPDPAVSPPRSAAVASNRSLRLHFPPSSRRDSSRLSRTSLSLDARLDSSTSTTRSRHTPAPFRAAASTSANFFVASSHVAFVASCASNAASAASDAAVISACASSYARCRRYTVAHVLSSRTRHTIASEWSSSTSTDGAWRGTSAARRLAVVRSRGRAPNTRPSRRADPAKKERTLLAASPAFNAPHAAR